MKTLKLILIVVAVIVLLVIGFLAYLGFFSALKPYESKLGPFTIAYQSFTGPYAQTGPIFDKVYKDLKAKGINSSLGLGIYYDDPSQVPAEKLRSDCGVVIELKDLPRLAKSGTKLKIKRIARQACIVVEFPLRNAFSYMIGPMKAYPVLMKYAQENDYQATLTYEIYDHIQGKILFILVIAK